MSGGSSCMGGLVGKKNSVKTSAAQEGSLFVSSGGKWEPLFQALTFLAWRASSSVPRLPKV